MPLSATLEAQIQLYLFILDLFIILNALLLLFGTVGNKSKSIKNQAKCCIQKDRWYILTPQKTREKNTTEFLNKLF